MKTTDTSKVAIALTEVCGTQATSSMSRHKLTKGVMTLLEVDTSDKALKKAEKKNVQSVIDSLVTSNKLFVLSKNGDGGDDDEVISLNPPSTSSLKEKKKKKEKKEKKRKEREPQLECVEEGSDASGDEAEAAAIKRHKQETDKMTAQNASSSSSSTATTTATNVVSYPPPPPIDPKDAVSILLFYAYCEPEMNRKQQDSAIAFCLQKAAAFKVTGRLRVAREGFNCTMTAGMEDIRRFTSSLEELDFQTFGEGRCDFKYVDGLPPNQRLKGLKIWPVQEIVTYGFDPRQAPLNMRGVHLKPKEFHEALEDPNSIVIDVRNFNESLIGRFVPPGDNPFATPTDDGTHKVLDPCMRRSTEFPKWVDDHKHMMEGKKVLMYCTGGVRCERASAFMRMKGVENVHQLEGGIHRYLETYASDGGHWKGKNYTFDKRFSHGSEVSDVISKCVVCADPWERYQANSKCIHCEMEVLVCRTCQRRPEGPPSKASLMCPLCKSNINPPRFKRTKPH
jgi:predicted sulfurtransferase